MKRALQLVALLLAGYTGMAQDLAYKIPEKARMVASFKTDQLFRLYPAAEFDTSAMGREMLEKISKKSSADFRSIEDLGLDLKGTIYYYSLHTDSINYDCVLIPIKDAAKVEKLFTEDERAAFTRQNGVTALQTAVKKPLVAWNNEIMVVTYGTLNKYFLEDSANAARYGISKTDEYGYDNVTDPTLYTDSAIAIADSATYYADSAATAAEPVTDIADSTTQPPAMEEMPMAVVDSVATVSVEGAESDAPPVAEDADVPPPPVAEPYYFDPNQERKDSLTKAWVQVYTTGIFNKPAGSASILANPDFIKGLDKNAIASFWLDNLNSTYAGFLPYYYMRYGSLFQGYGSINARMYMNNENMRITGELGLDDAKTSSYKKIYNRKLNKKFLKYINSDSLIGFMSYAFDTKAYLDEIPRMFNGIYGMYKDETEIGADLFSLLLDEEAVAKVAKGDALFVLSNVSPKEVSYHTYAYDENYEYKDTVKTKTETLPDFLFMFSSEDTRLFVKLLEYGIKKGKVTFAHNIYSITSSRKNPFNLHILFKDGIVFLGTSLTDMEQISTDTYRGNLSRQHEELLMKNNMTLYFNPNHLGNKLFEGEFRDLGAIADNLKGMGDVYIKSSGVKDNNVSFDLVSEVPKDKGNALKYFISLMQDISKLK